MTTVTMTVNGREVSGEAEPRMLLAHFLREGQRLTGTHLGCDTSQCGACVILRKRGRRKPDQPNAAVTKRRRKADSIQHRATTENQDVALAVKRERLQVAEHTLHVGPTIFHGFATNNCQRRTREFHLVCVDLRIALQFAAKFRVRGGEA